MIKNHRLKQGRGPEKGGGKKDGGKPDYLGHHSPFQLFDQPSCHKDGGCPDECRQEPDGKQAIAPQDGMDAGYKCHQGRGAEKSPVQVFRLCHIEVGIPLKAIVGGG